jgi:hypothetical protein
MEHSEECYDLPWRERCADCIDEHIEAAAEIVAESIRDYAE